MTHWLPQWLLDLGSIGGLITVVFLIADRLLKGRPSIGVGTEVHGHRYLIVSAQSGVEISISAFRSRGGVYRLSKDTEVVNIIQASAGGPFVATIPGGATAKFLLLAQVSGKETLAYRYRWTPCWIAWRKATSLWLPQIPVLTIIDNEWLRNMRNGGFEMGEHERPG